MYATRPALRYPLIFGILGLAALTPPKGQYPTWLVMSLVLAPLVLLELGAAIEEEVVRRRTVLVARGLQLAGALSYPLVLGIFVGLRGLRLDGSALLGLGLASSGALSVVILLRAGSGWLLGETEESPRRWPLFDGLVIATLICLAFVIVEVLLFIRRPELAGSPKLLAGLFFFGGGFVLLGSQLVSRWRLARGGGEGLKRLGDWAQLLGLLVLGVGLLVTASDSEISPFFRGLLYLGGAAVGVGGAVIAGRRVFGVRSALSYHAVREGLLERSRKHVLLYPWANVLQVSLGELHGNTALFLRLEEDEASPTVIWQKNGTPEKLRQRRQKSHRTSLAFTGAELVIMEIAIDGDLGALFEQIRDVFRTEEHRERLPPMEQLVAGSLAVTAGTQD